MVSQVFEGVDRKDSYTEHLHKQAEIKAKEAREVKAVADLKDEVSSALQRLGSRRGLTLAVTLQLQC